MCSYEWNVRNSRERLERYFEGHECHAAWHIVGVQLKPFDERFGIDVDCQTIKHNGKVVKIENDAVINSDIIRVVDPDEGRERVVRVKTSVKNERHENENETNGEKKNRLFSGG